MSLHWTYREVGEDDLLQGDILERTDALIDVLQEYHPYFCREEYTGFLVLTQSCDLVRDNRGECKAPYINIAVIRELEPLLPELLSPICGAAVDNVYVEERRYEARDVLRKVINQNDQARGLFYLHPVSTEKRSLRILAFPSVGLLRVSIALRSQHYGVLLDARRFHLDGEYANKLGWLSGNLFSRVATKDWEDQEGDARASEVQCNKLLEAVTEKDGQNWVPASWLEAARKQGRDLSAIRPAVMRSELDSIKPPSAVESAAQVVAEVAEQTIANPTLENIQKNLAANQAFLTQVADHCVSLVEDRLESDERAHLREALIEAKYGATLATFVVRCILREFNREELPLEQLGDFLRERKVEPDTIKVLGNHLRRILNDDQRASAIKHAAENKQLFSDEAISTIEGHLSAQIPVLRSAASVAASIANRTKNNGKFKDAFRVAAVR